MIGPARKSPSVLSVQPEKLCAGYWVEDADAARTDVGPGVELGDRVSAADAAEVHYRLATVRDRTEWVVGQEEKGLVSGD